MIRSLTNPNDGFGSYITKYCHYCSDTLSAPMLSCLRQSSMTIYTKSSKNADNGDTADDNGSIRNEYWNRNWSIPTKRPPLKLQHLEEQWVGSYGHRCQRGWTRRNTRSLRYYSNKDVVTVESPSNENKMMMHTIIRRDYNACLHLVRLVLGLITTWKPLMMMLLLIRNSWTMTRVLAYPNGTGSCVGRIPATSFSQHANPLIHPTIISQDLSFFNITVYIREATSLDNNSSDNDTPVTLLHPNSDNVTNRTKNNTNHTFETQKEYRMTVRANTIPFIGIFIRLQALNNQSDLNTALIENDDMTLKSADYICNTIEDENVVGLTHVNNTDKNRVVGLLYFTDIGSVNIDLTVVLPTDNSSTSAFAYNNYTINFVESNKTESTLPPTVTTTLMPSDNSTKTSQSPSDDITVASATPTLSPATISTTRPTLSSTLVTKAPTDDSTPLSTSSPSLRLPPSSPSSNVIDLAYTQLINENIENIQVPFDNVPTLRLSDLRNAEVILTNWFVYFFNNRTNQLLPTDATN
jgi:hypothetical protein